MQAVTRVKLEQASKVKMRTPTRLRNGEGRTDREEARRGSALLPSTKKHLFRSTGVVSTACRKGIWVSGGGSGLAEVASPNVAGKGGGQSGSRRGPYDR